MIEKYFKFPFKADELYIWDSDNRMVGNWLRDINEELREKVINSINKRESLGLKDVTVVEDKIFLEGNPFFLVRGWGYLTGLGGLGLPPKKAIEIQNELLNYIAKCLE